MSYPEPQPKTTFKKEVRFILAMALAVACLWVFALRSEGSEPFVYPPQCSGMSGEDFFDWATKFNESQRIVRSSEPKWFQASGVRTRYVLGPQGFTLVREAYPTRYLNPDYVPPSPLMVINPYCKPKR